MSSRALRSPKVGVGVTDEKCFPISSAHETLLSFTEKVILVKDSPSPYPLAAHSPWRLLTPEG